MIVAISILGLLVVVLGFTTINLLKKNEKQEDILMGYLTYIDKMDRIINFIDEKLKEIDHKGSFEADDEIGFFFEEIKNFQSILNAFKVEEFTPDNKK